MKLQIVEKRCSTTSNLNFHTRIRKNPHLVCDASVAFFDWPSKLFIDRAFAIPSFCFFFDVINDFLITSASPLTESITLSPNDIPFASSPGNGNVELNNGWVSRLVVEVLAMDRLRTLVMLLSLPLPK